MQQAQITLANEGGILDRINVYAATSEALENEITLKVMEIARNGLRPGDVIRILGEG